MGRAGERGIQLLTRRPDTSRMSLLSPAVAEPLAGRPALSSLGGGEGEDFCGFLCSAGCGLPNKWPHDVPILPQRRCVRLAGAAITLATGTSCPALQPHHDERYVCRR